MWWVFVSAAARAGCAVDEHGDERRKAAGLALSGVVERVDVAPGRSPESASVLQYVRVEHTYKGQVESGWIVLRSEASGHFCPPDRAYAVGERLYAVGTPEGGSEIAVSACTADTGILREDSEAWLRKLPRRFGERYEGSPPPPPRSPPAPMPAPGPRALRVVSALAVGPTLGTLETHLPEHPLEGQILETSGSMHRALFTLPSLQLALWVDERGLDTVATREVRLVGDDTAWLRLQPGASVEVLSERGDEATVRIESDGLTAEGTLARSDLGLSWTLSAPPDPLPLYLVQQTPLWHHPGGPVLATLSPSEGLTLRAAGPPSGELLPVEVHTPHATAEGYIGAAATAEGVAGGVVGGVTSRRMIGLRAGVSLSSANDEVIFGVVREDRYEQLVYQGDSEVFVLLDTPLGRFLARARCEAPIEPHCTAP